VAPRRSARDVIVVSNVGSTAITLRLGTSDGVTAANSGSAFGPLASLDTKVDVNGVTAGWIQTLVRLSVNVRNVGQRFTKGPAP
jgi:hypothetical protein